MAICVMAVVGVAPCQCFSPGENQTTSPGRISSIGPPHRCAHPRPDVTINACPSGCVCQAVRAPGSNVTLAQRTRAGSGASNSGSMRTVPVNQSAGPLVELCEPDLLISIFFLSTLSYQPSTPPATSSDFHFLNSFELDRLQFSKSKIAGGNSPLALPTEALPVTVPARAYAQA